MKISGVKQIDIQGQKELSQNRTTIFAGNSTVANQTSELIRQRKEEAQKQAMKIVGDVFEGQHQIDQSKEEAHRRIDQNKQNMKEAQDQIKRLEEQKKTMMSAEGEDQAVAKDALAEIETMQELWEKTEESNRMMIRSENAALVDTKIEELKSHAMVDATKSADEIGRAHV